MRLDRVRLWQWMVIGLIVGYAAAMLRGHVAEPLLNSYGESINGQGVFEEALLTRVDGEFRFHDLNVQLVSDPNGGGTAHVVRGMFWDGRADDADKPVWRPAFFVARVPYKPLTDLALLDQTKGPELAKRFAALARPTVLDFLRALSEARGVAYRHAWWNSYARLTWFAGCFIGFGLAMPAVVNLLLFGRLIRPASPPEPMASPGSSPAPVATVKPTLSDADLARLEMVTSGLESAIDGDKPLSATDAAAVAPTVVPQLKDEPLSASAAIEKHEREFGADQDDYYPTERHHRS